MPKITVQNICQILEEFAPLALQEDYDNAGLLVGNPATIVTSILTTVDCTEEILDEAIQHNCNMIVAHHPLIFAGIKQITGKDYIQKTIIKAIKNNIAIYAAHTNIDNVFYGVNGSLASKIGLTDCQILQPKSNQLTKLITYVPNSEAHTLRQAIFDVGAGAIGNYNQCSFNTQGIGTFEPQKGSNPYVGKQGTLQNEPETKIEIILPNYLQDKVIKALLTTHPYEEPAFDLVPINNQWNRVGVGMIGNLPQELTAIDFLHLIKEKLKLITLKYTKIAHRSKIKRVAICGGAGSQYVYDAIRQKADIFISGDFKYHQFFDVQDQIIIADIGHYESEAHTKELFYEIITKKIPTFAVRISQTDTNPIKYL